MTIDWSKHDPHPENTATCICGYTYRTHTKMIFDPPHIEARKPCPGCGKSDHIRHSSSDPEHMSLGS